jgi:serine/threonine protein kinase
MDLKLPLEADDVIADKYVVERVIGQGAIGVVVAARHRQLRQNVAIKFLRPELAERADLAEQFRRHARAAASVHGERVCRVLDVSTGEGALPYVVMEYAEGQDLASELAQRELFPYAEAVDYVLQACEGLAEACVAGLVHCDLKPSKLFLTRRPDGSRCVKLLDLGTSQLSNDTPANLHAALQQPAAAQPPAWLHAFEYLAPEQLDALEQVTPTTNVWALGALLYRLLFGQPPFPATSAAQFAQALRDDPVPAVVGTGRELPDGLAAVVQRALAKDVSERYRSIAELAQALAPFASPRARVSAERVSRLLPDAGALARSQEPRRRRSQRWRRLVMAVLLPPAVALALWVGQRRGPVEGARPHLQLAAAGAAAAFEPALEPAPEPEREPLDEAVTQEAAAGSAAVPVPVPRRRVTGAGQQPTAAVRRPEPAAFRITDFGGRR